MVSVCLSVVTNKARQAKARRLGQTLAHSKSFSITLAFPGRYLLAVPHELFPAMPTVECCQFIKLMQSFKSKEYVKASVLAWKKGGSTILNKWV